MNVEVKFTRKSFIKAMVEVENETGVDVHWILHDVMRLWVVDLIRFTVPPSRSAGIKTLTADIERIFAPIDDTAVLEAWADAARDDTDGWLIRKSRKTGQPYRISTNMFTSQRGKLDGWHKIHRSRRTGRTRTPTPRSSGETAAWGGRKPVPRAMLERYTKEQKKRVGIAKAGFMEGALKFNAKAPAFVRNNKSHAEGWANDTLTKELNGYLEAANAVKYARMTRGIGKTLDHRLRDLKSGRYTERLRRTMAKHSSGGE